MSIALRMLNPDVRSCGIIIAKGMRQYNEIHGLFSTGNGGGLTEFVDKITYEKTGRELDLEYDLECKKDNICGCGGYTSQHGFKSNDPKKKAMIYRMSRGKNSLNPYYEIHIWWEGDTVEDWEGDIKTLMALPHFMTSNIKYKLSYQKAHGSKWEYLECNHEVKLVEEELNLEFPSKIVAAKMDTLNPKETYETIKNFKKEVLGQVQKGAWFVYPEVQPWWNIQRLTKNKDERKASFGEMIELVVPVVYGYWKYSEKREVGKPEDCGFFSPAGKEWANVGENCMQLGDLIHKKTKIPQWRDAEGNPHAEEYSVPAYNLHVWKTKDDKKILPLICAESLYYFDNPKYLPKVDLIIVNYEFDGPVPEYLGQLALKAAKKLDVKIVGVIPEGIGLQSFYADAEGFTQGVVFEI